LARIFGEQPAQLLSVEPYTAASGTTVHRDTFDLKFRQRGGLAFWTIHRFLDSPFSQKFCKR
jgi:hypothetical protein